MYDTNKFFQKLSFSCVFYFIMILFIQLDCEQHNGQKKKVQKDKQRSSKSTHKIKDRVTRTPLITGGDLKCSGRVSSSCYTSYKPGDKS